MTDMHQFMTLRRAYHEHRVAGRHDEALAAALELWDRFPDERDTSWFMAAGGLAGTGRQDEAVAFLERALAEGHLWRVGLLSVPDLDGLRAHPGFRDLEARARAVVASRGFAPRLLVAAPTAPAPPPLLLGLHGASSVAEDVHRHWLRATRLGWLVATVQSSQPASPSTFCWDDLARTRHDVGQMAARLPEHGPVVLAGFSQGAGAALDLALAGDPLPAEAVIAVGPSFPPDRAFPETSRPIRVLVLRGSLDPYGRGLPEGARRLTAAGHTVTIEEIPGLGHEFPADFEARLPELLARTGV